MAGAGAAALLSTAFLACDPGVHYRPRDWRTAGPYRWATTVEEMDIETAGVGSLAGSTGVNPELTIHNASLAPVRVVGGRLETGAGVFEAVPHDPRHEDSFTIQPGETKRVTLSFRLARPAGEILVDPAALIVFFRTGSGRREVAIPLRKE